MQRHFHEELDALKQTLLAMGGLVEDQIRRVMRALIERDDDLAREVIERDRQVNAYDIEIDEKCVELLALHQPAAGDLRFITTAMKIVTDLERIGDQAVNIAQRAIELNLEPQLKPYVDLPRMAERAQRMVKESLDAFVGRDTALARKVCAEGAALPRAADLHDGGSEDDPARDPAHSDLALPRARGRPCHEHRRDGDLHGREQDGAPHARLTPAGAARARGCGSLSACPARTPTPKPTRSRSCTRAASRTGCPSSRPRARASVGRSRRRGATPTS
jgi:phosphate transport system regulatory protein PhoU